MSILKLKKSKRIRKVSFLQKLIRHYFHDVYVKDLAMQLDLEAMRESINYIKNHMTDSMICPSWHDLHNYAIENASLDGLFMEFGVKKGATIREIAKMTTKTVHGFDSFQGLPENWTGTSLRKGRFNKQGNLPKVPESVVLHQGWFDDSLPKFTQDNKQPVAYMHIDCDLYSSTVTIFEQLSEQIIPGTVIVFDEYFNYPNWQQHEHKALQEFVKENQLYYEYLAFTSHGSSVAVKITGKVNK